MRATLDLIEKSESSEFYRDLTLTFQAAFAARDEKKRVPHDKLLNPGTEEEFKQSMKVGFFLNHYELIASGFESGVLDKGFYASYIRGALVQDWKAVKNFVIKLRESNVGTHPTPETIYRQFENLASEWGWEIGHEEKLRRKGRSEKQIAAAIQYFRKHKNKTRPPL